MELRTIMQRVLDLAQTICDTSTSGTPKNCFARTPGKRFTKVMHLTRLLKLARDAAAQLSANLPETSEDILEHIQDALEKAVQRQPAAGERTLPLDGVNTELVEEVMRNIASALQSQPEAPPVSTAAPGTATPEDMTLQTRQSQRSRARQAKMPRNSTPPRHRAQH